LKSLLQEHFLACGRPNDPTSLVFGTSKRTRIVDTFNGIIKYEPLGTLRMPARFLHALHKACDSAGVDRIRWHDLRHYYASVMLKVYPNEIWRVSNYLGHEQVSTTTDIYGHWIEDETDNDKEVDKVSSAFG